MKQKYKSNYLSLIDNKLSNDVNEFILNLLFIEVKNNRFELIEEIKDKVFEMNYNKIQDYFEDFFKCIIPFSVECVNYKEDLNEIIYTFNPGESKIIYYDSSQIINDITQWNIEIENNLIEYNLLCVDHPKCGCCNTNKEYILTKKELIECLISIFISEINKLITEFDWVEDYLEYRFLDDIKLKRENNIIIIDYCIGYDTFF